MRSLGYGAAVILIGYGVYRIAPDLANATALRIDRILVSGNAQLSADEVLAALDGLRGSSIVWADLEAWRQRLQALPWVSTVAFRRYLPSTIEVILTERSPMAIARIKGELHLIDGRGELIDAYGPQYAHFDLPIVDGLVAEDDEGVDGVRPGRAELAAQVIAAFEAEPEVAARISQVDVSDPQNAAVILSGDPAVIYMGRERFLPRLRSYLQLADTMRERVAAIDYVDLRFENWVYVGPTRGSRGLGAPAARIGGGTGSVGR
jgi:cell division septal protein FtsQ